MDPSQQRERILRQRLPLLLLGGALLLGLFTFGLSLRQQPGASASELPQNSGVRLAVLSDGPSGRFVLDQPAPNFALTYADGEQLRLSDLRGLPVVLNFWATWCLPCKAEMPELQGYYSAAGGSFALLAINMRETPAVAAAFATELDLTFPLVIDPEGALATSYRVTVLPTTYLIDAAGIVRAQHLGPLNQAQLRELLAARS